MNIDPLANTEPSAQFPPTPEPHSPAPPKSRLTIWISWIIILGLAGLIAYRAAGGEGNERASEIVNDSRARMAGLFAMQFKAFVPGKPSTLAMRAIGSGDRLVEDLERDARTVRDRLQAAIVRGELHDGKDALNVINGLSLAGEDPETVRDVAVLKNLYSDGAKELDAESRERLESRYGDLGKLALSYGVPATEEPRRSLQTKAFTFMLRVFVLGAVFLGLFVLVVGFFILAVVLFARGKLSAAYKPGERSGVFVEGFALYFILFLALSLVIRLLGGNGVVGLWLALPIPLVVALWLMWRGRTWQQVRMAIGWHTGRGVLREAAAGIAGYCAGLVFVAVGALITLMLVRATGARPSSPVVEELQSSPWHIVGVFAAACIVAPILEETMFRGVLFHHLRERWRWIVSAPLTAVIFAAVHPQGWAAIPVLSAIAIVLAGLREWRGSLIAPIVAHACNNGVALIAALLILGG